MNDSLFEFVPGVFWKVLAATLTVVMLGWVGAMWIFGELKTVDIVGSLISAPISLSVGRASWRLMFSVVAMS